MLRLFLAGPALAAVSALFVALPAHAQIAATRVHVVDVGNGLCVVANTPEGKTLLYDAGYSGDYCREAVRAVAGLNPIDIVVFSHSDEDHINKGSEILDAQGARLIMHPGDARTGRYLDPLRVKIAELERRGTTVINMAVNPQAVDAPRFGKTFALGTATLRFIAGWSDGVVTAKPGDPVLPDSDRKNALSLVVRLEYGGRSVLLTGDTIGRRREDNGSACRNAELFMKDGTAPIDSDVLIGQHHGGNNSTSNCFIRAVSPKWVVFSAGKGHGHPKQAVADRLIANHIDPDHILRTDRAEEEGEGQCIYGIVAGCPSRAGDDDVEILLYADGREPSVQYARPETACPSRAPGGSLPPLRRARAVR